MYDSNWENVTGEVAHEIEFLNYANQVNVIESLVRLFLHQAGVEDHGCNWHPNSEALREFHRTATLFLLMRPGVYREEAVYLKKPCGEIVYTPPSHELVANLIDEFFNQLAQMWRVASAVEVGAYCLWFINWVHPFLNGNGRSARAFCYACVSLKMGFVLPGKDTLIDLLMQERVAYQDALRVADIGYDNTGKPDLAILTNLVGQLLLKQLESLDLGE